MQTYVNQLTMDDKIDEVPLSKYPRPHLKRDSFMCLNGKWDDGCLVPFPIGSKNAEVDAEGLTEYTYKRKVCIKKEFIKDIILLHFGAVDQIAEVFIDDIKVGRHEGGYIPFEFDITSYVKPDVSFELTVKVKDELDHTYPYGKQKYKRGGMWYTPVMGIWQSVWIESVAKDYIKDIEITPYLDRISVNVVGGEAPFNVKVSFKEDAVYEGSFDAPFFQVKINNPKLWSPESPSLYDISIATKTDEIKSYFGLRTVEVSKVNGVARILLNKKPVFFNGVLDQGYFPEGIFTPNSEKSYEDDILRLKSLGINTIRKHIKIEPECFYEACDRLGMFVFQDMVNNGDYKFFRDTLYPTFISKKKDDTKGKHSEEAMYFFESQMEETLAHLYNFPSIVYYTVFNEGWGQFDSDIMYNIVKAMDRTRIIDSTSGWFWQEESDVDSLHVYFKPVKIKPSERPVIVSEFGGFSYKEEGHIFNTKKSYGYGGEKTKEALTKRIEKLYLDEIVPAIKDGLCGTVYTQITDVEDEINGFFTYDRKVCKVDEKVMKEISKKLTIK